MIRLFTAVVVYPRIVIIIFNINHILFIGYNIVDYCNVVLFDLDFNTAGNICQMIFWFVDEGINYNPIDFFGQILSDVAYDLNKT